VTDAFARLQDALSDRYTVERELGQGGMATVYLAEDLKHHRKVALEVLRRRRSGWSSGRGRLGALPPPAAAPAGARAARIAENERLTLHLRP